MGKLYRYSDSLTRCSLQGNLSLSFTEQIPILRTELDFFDTGSTDQVRNLLACWLRTYSFVLSIQIMKGTLLNSYTRVFLSHLCRLIADMVENRIHSCNGNVEKLHIYTIQLPPHCTCFCVLLSSYGYFHLFGRI
jgi:hypothetical protein